VHSVQRSALVLNPPHARIAEFTRCSSVTDTHYPLPPSGGTSGPCLADFFPAQLITTNEDTLVRVYVAGALAQELPHPGTPWNVQRLANGDIVTCCNQSGQCRWLSCFVSAVAPPVGLSSIPAGRSTHRAPVSLCPF
jgi:hypothetical protein